MSFMTAELSSQIPTVLIMLSVICVVGTVGNLLVIIVYALKHDRLTSTLFILVLAVTDFLACLTLIPGTITIEYLEWKMRSSFLCKSYYLLNNSFIPFSSLLISCIAFDRYFCLCHPFAKIMTFVRAKRIIGVLVFACLFQGGCSTFLVRIEKVQSVSSYSDSTIANGTSVEFVQSENGTLDDTYECTEVIRVNATMLEYVWYRVTQKIQIVSYVFCILSVTVLYILIYSSVSKVFKKRKQLKGYRSKPMITRLENYQQSQFEPELINEHVDQCRNNQLSCAQNRSLSASSTNVDHFRSTEELNGHRSSIVRFQPKYSDPLSSSVNRPIEPEESEQSLRLPMPESKVSVTSSCSNTELKPISSYRLGKKPNRTRRVPKISIQAEYSSGVTTLPIEPEGRSGIFNGERSRISVRHLADSATFQNLKTAGMLFVVAIVYIVAFLPAMLMANELITLYLPVFYLYYVNNAINPIVYGFMNPNFRADIRKLFSQKCRCSRL